MFVISEGIVRSIRLIGDFGPRFGPSRRREN
jgi:hypothetical protein